MARYSVLLEGGAGSGKTYSLGTIVEAGKELFILATEPGVENCPSIRRILAEEGGKEKVHLHYVSPSNPSWDMLIDSAKKINTLPNASLMKLPGINRDEHAQFMELLSACANFKCSLCGKEFGPVDWDEEFEKEGKVWNEEKNSEGEQMEKINYFDKSKVLVLDGLTGTGTMSMNCVIGSKPMKTQPDWGVAMDQLERFIQKLVYNTKCSFVLIAHIEKQIDPVEGGMVITLSTLGNKLAPKIPPIFDEVVHAVRHGKAFHWATETEGYDLKARKLPLEGKIGPTFVQLFEGDD